MGVLQQSDRWLAASLARGSQPSADIHLPLPRREVEGVIFAKGGSKVPPERPDGTPIKVELLLRDEAGNEICAEFGVPARPQLEDRVGKNDMKSNLQVGR